MLPVYTTSLLSFSVLRSYHNSHQSKEPSEHHRGHGHAQVVHSRESLDAPVCASWPLLTVISQPQLHVGSVTCPYKMTGTKLDPGLALRAEGAAQMAQCLLSM